MTVATSPSAESSPYWTAIVACPSAWSVGISLLNDDPSAQMPWQKTRLGLPFADMCPPLLDGGQRLSNPGVDATNVDFGSHTSSDASCVRVGRRSYETPAGFSASRNWPRDVIPSFGKRW